MDMSSVKSGINSIFLKDNQRYVNGEWNLDLTYVTPRVIAMGVPGESVAAAYRNPLTEVAAFLNAQHANHYLVFNLSCIRYDYSRLNNQVVEYFFMDHHPPPINLLMAVVNAMQSFLAADERNVVVVHCKAGRGRTGVVVSSFFVREGICNEPHEAVELFSLVRTSTSGCVEYPSQRRYVDYYAQLLRRQLSYRPTPLFLDRVVLKNVAEALYVGAPSQKQLPFLEIRSLATNQIILSTAYEPYRLTIEGDSLIYTFGKYLEGDLLFRFMARTGNFMNNFMETETCRFCLNTFFVVPPVWQLGKKDVDFQPRDDRFTEQFSVSAVFIPPDAQTPLDVPSLAANTHTALPPSSTSVLITQSPDSKLSPSPWPAVNGHDSYQHQYQSAPLILQSPPPPIPSRSPPPPPFILPSGTALSLPPSSSSLKSLSLSLPPQSSRSPSSSPCPLSLGPHPLLVPSHAPVLPPPDLPSLGIAQSYRTPPRYPQAPATALPLSPAPSPSPSPLPPPSPSPAPSPSSSALYNGPAGSRLIAVDDEIAAYLEEEKNESMRIIS